MDCIDYASIGICKNGERMVYVEDNTTLNECEISTTTFNELYISIERQEIAPNFEQ